MEKLDPRLQEERGATRKMVTGKLLALFELLLLLLGILFATTCRNSTEAIDLESVRCCINTTAANMSEYRTALAESWILNQEYLYLMAVIFTICTFLIGESTSKFDRFWTFDWENAARKSKIFVVGIICLSIFTDLFTLFERITVVPIRDQSDCAYLLNYTVIMAMYMGTTIILNVNWAWREVHDSMRVAGRTLFSVIMVSVMAFVCLESYVVFLTLPSIMWASMLIGVLMALYMAVIVADRYKKLYPPHTFIHEMVHTINQQNRRSVDAFHNHIVLSHSMKMNSGPTFKVETYSNPIKV